LWNSPSKKLLVPDALNQYLVSILVFVELAFEAHSIVRQPKTNFNVSILVFVELAFEVS